MSERLRRIALSVLLTVVASRADAALFGSVAQTPHPAVCRVAVEERDGKAFGSGTLIDCREAYGLVVTNWHVVHEAKGKIEVRFPDGFTSEARPLKLDETWDLAALVVWRPPIAPARLAMSPPQPGDRLTICGYGQGEYLQQTGRCTDYYSPEVGEPQEIVELNVQARQGDSGGPIFNDRGELAGVLFGAARGTTLGSFGGRVQTFLATLAPDIGAAKQPTTLIAQTPPPSPTVHAAASMQTVGDPFLAAERSASATAASSFPTPPPALSDRSSAPQLAASHRAAETSRHSAEAWKPAPPDPTATMPIAPVLTPAGVSTQFAEVSAAPPAGNMDWYEEGRTLLALVGIAAIVMTGLRTLG
jgi:serine protease Do